jgi:L-histidine Nalpha-methyltransferase
LVDVFVSSDKTTIKLGENWFERIETGLRQANLLLVLCSENSISGPWINFEAGVAWMHKIPIIPVCHSGLLPRHLPMPLNALQAVEAHEEIGMERLYDLIADLLKCSRPRDDFNLLTEQIKDLNYSSLIEKNPRKEKTNSLSQLERAINAAKLGWTLCIVGEDQSDKLAILTEDLRRGFSMNGDGKQFASGFSYWGIVPTLAWARACNDPLYLVMKKSIELFPERWDKVKPYISTPYHYVSLGVGTGVKDRCILRDLRQSKHDIYYFPVDMSPEMLRVGLKECLKSKDLQRCRQVPIQIDFSMESNIVELQQILQRILGNEPVMFSLLGNTLANFEANITLLKTLRKLMRPQDRLLLEVATTERLDVSSIQFAADEYARSKAFKKFVTSALIQYTALPVNEDKLDFYGAPEGERAILIKVVYANKEGRVLSMKLPDNSTIDFVPNDTIRLLVTRKYTSQGILELIDETGFLRVAYHRELQPRDVFGLDLILLEKN